MSVPKKVLVLLGLACVIAALLITATALAASGDYGVNTGASTQSSNNCGGTGQPACNITVNGYDFTYSHTESDGTQVYTFDDFDCTVYISTNGNSSGRGPECNQYQP